MPDLRAIVLDGLDASVHHQCSKPLHAFHALEDHTACHDVGVFPVWDPVLLNGFFQDGIGVVWVCFVPFRTVFVWCGFVLYHLYCFQVYSYTTGTTQYLFHNQNGSKIVLCANNCRPQMELFCTIETFFVPQSDSIPHFMFQGSHMSQEGLKQVSHPLIFEYWARDSDLGFRSQRRGVA